MIRTVLRHTRATSVTSNLSHHLAPAAATVTCSDLAPNFVSSFTFSSNSSPFGGKVRDFHAKSVLSDFHAADSYGRASIIGSESSMIVPSGIAFQGYATVRVGRGDSPDNVKPLSRKAIALQKEKAEESTSKIKGTKICIAIRSFDNPQKQAWSLPAHTRNVAMPDTRTLYTVLRSPHVDKKSREQFEMRFKKRFLVIKAESHELSKKLFWLKRYRILGAQYELQFHCKTRLDMTHVRHTINASTKAQ